MTGAQLLQFVVSGLTLGCIYALVALGFTIIFNSSGIVNFAQGDFVMLSALFAASLSSFAVPLPVAVLLGGIGPSRRGGVLGGGVYPARGGYPCAVFPWGSDE